MIPLVYMPLLQKSILLPQASNVIQSIVQPMNNSGMIQANPFNLHTGLNHNFQIIESNGAPVPVIASIPHSGTIIPAEISERLFPRHLDFPKHTDWYVDQLYNFLTELGVTIIQADYSRYVVDLNRRPVEPLYGPFQTSPVISATSDGDLLYHRPPDGGEILRRIQNYFIPYHNALKISS